MSNASEDATLTLPIPGIRADQIVLVRNSLPAISDPIPVISAISTRSQKRNPAPPFTTSTLQQEASRKLGFNPRRTMRAAQSLYEGVSA